MSDNKPCCSCGSSCCSSQQESKRITIDFLYLDLEVCERCQGTENSLDQAVRDVSDVLKMAGADVRVNKIHIASKEDAIANRFVSSPTIRVNGRDIALEVRESDCGCCKDICGESVDCRVWVYEGKEYSQPPKPMIINAILEAVYSCKGESADSLPYVLPENLERFFDGLERKNRQG